MREEDTKIKQLFLLDNKTAEEISAELNVSLNYVQKILKNFNSPVRSKGENTLLSIFRNIFPGVKVLEQHPIGGLYLDIYIPKMRLAIEYDGIQHSQVTWFHGKGINRHYLFEHQQENDRKKEELCKAHNIYLIRIPYTEKLTHQYIEGVINEHRQAIIDSLESYRNKTMGDYTVDYSKDRFKL